MFRTHLSAHGNLLFVVEENISSYKKPQLLLMQKKYSRLFFKMHHYSHTGSAFMGAAVPDNLFAILQVPIFYEDDG
jgi:hypothetical protein